MADWEEQLPEWNEAGAEPPQDKKDEGWEEGEKPPAGWFNWLFNRVYGAIKEIRESLHSVAISGSYTDLSDVPSEFEPEEHGNEKHSEDYITEVLDHGSEKHTDITSDGASDGDTLVWNDTEEKWEPGKSGHLEAHLSDYASEENAGHIKIGNNLEIDEEGVLHAEEGYPQSNFNATTEPTENDDETQGYSRGSKWFVKDEIDEENVNYYAYVCLDATEGTALWKVYQEDTVDDASGAPGPVILQEEGNYDDGNYGYYGFTTSEDLISGDNLASELGLTAGTGFNSNAGWIKYERNDKVCFMAKKPFRHSLSWDDIDAVNAVDGGAIVTIDGNEYKVRILKGGTEDGEGAGANEWNTIMYNIVNCAEDGMLGDNWDDYSNDDVGIGGESDPDGRRSCCQETDPDDSARRVLRGLDRVSSFGTRDADAVSSWIGWRPVLELASS